MVGLGVVERAGLGEGPDLGGDPAVAGGGQRGLVALAGGRDGGELRVRGRVDRGAVLRAVVVALAVLLRRVVVLPERLEQHVDVDPRRVVDDQDGLGVAGAPGAGLLVRRVRREPARVAGGGRDHTGDLPEDPLGAPEAAHADVELLRALGERRDHRRPEHLVPVRDGHGRVPARQGGLGGRHLRAAEQPHGGSPVVGRARSNRAARRDVPLTRCGSNGPACRRARRPAAAPPPRRALRWSRRRAAGHRSGTGCAGAGRAPARRARRA